MSLYEHMLEKCVVRINGMRHVHMYGSLACNLCADQALYFSGPSIL